MSYASFNNVKNVAFDKKNNTNQINNNKNTETLKNENRHKILSNFSNSRRLS